MNVDELIAMRAEKDQFFKQGEQSPLTPEQQDHFTGLRYYPPNADLDLIVAVEEIDGGGTIAIETTRGETRYYKRWGRFRFTVDGEEVELTIYDAPYGFFIPFADVNAGGETYGAGRYLEPEQLEDGRFHIDFNIAYNPYCAYNDGWNCPITPKENRLKVAVRAGEMSPEGAWVSMG